MKKIFISYALLLSIVSSSLFACSNFQSEVKNDNTITPTTEAISADQPYYSVTTAHAIYDKNKYMELDVKIPKIEYSNETSNVLFDKINKEIFDNILAEVDIAKTNAMNTYEIYLNSAKENFQKDKENKLIALKNKYKSIIGDKEVKAMSNAISTMIDEEADDLLLTEPTSSNAIYGFTNSDQLIIPGLHNKNIIVIETTKTESPMVQTTINIEGRPGKDKSFVVPEESAMINEPAPSFRNSEEKKNNKIRKKDSAKSNEGSIPQKQSFDKNNKVYEDKKNDGFNTNKNQTSAIIDAENQKEVNVNTETNEVATISNVELTIDGFYKELEEISNIKIPSRQSLENDYIPTSIYCGFDVKCLDEDYLSLFIELSENRATSKSTRYYYNVDLKNQKLISLYDLLGDEYISTCINSINNSISKWSDEKKKDLIEGYDLNNFINNKTYFFINNNHRPVVVLEKNTVVAGVTGYPEFQIVK